MSTRSICFGIWLALSGVFISGAGSVYGQVQHPYYLQALSDFRMARALLLQHIDGKPMTHNEKEALRQINVVIREINEASIDGKEPAQPKAQGSLLQCVEFLNKAKNDLSHEEDARFSGGLRDRSLKNCDAAIRFVQQEGGK